MEHLRQVHLVPTKHVISYLKGTLDYGLRYVAYHEFELYGYSDSDWVGSILDPKSTSSYCFSLGSITVSWSSRKQSCVAPSTVEAEYVAAFVACRESVWLQNILSRLFGLKLEALHLV
jgi:hypothetical protein